MLKYLVICVNGNQDVCSVDPFDTEEEANAFLAEDAKRVYDEILDHYNSDIDVSPGQAEVVDGEEVYGWSIYPLDIDIESDRGGVIPNGDQDLARHPI